MPYYPINSGNKAHYSSNTSDIKIVSEYTLCTVPEVFGMDVLSYWGLLHDAVIWRCGSTPEGREYLENAWYYEQTDIDRDGLRGQFGGENNG